MRLFVDLTANPEDTVFALLRRFEETETDYFFNDFILQANDYPKAIHDILYGLFERIDGAGSIRSLASVGIAILALYDLSRPEHDSELTIEQDRIACRLIAQVE